MGAASRLALSQQQHTEPAATGDKIKVVCNSCGARYLIPSTKVRGHRFRARCKNCSNVIVARCTASFAIVAETESGVQPQDSPPLPEHAPASSQEARSWYVVLNGGPHGPITAEEIRQAFAVQQINEKSYVWRVGDAQWLRLESSPYFADLVVDDPTNLMSDSQQLQQMMHAMDAAEPGEDLFGAQGSILGGPDADDEETEIHPGGEGQYDLPVAPGPPVQAQPQVAPRPPAAQALDAGPLVNQIYDPAGTPEAAPEYLPGPWGVPNPDLTWGQAAPDLWPREPISARKAELPAPTGKPRLLKLVTDEPEPEPEPVQEETSVAIEPQAAASAPKDQSASMAALSPPTAQPFSARDSDLPDLSASAPPLAAAQDVKDATIQATPYAGRAKAAAPFWTMKRMVAAACIIGSAAVVFTIALVLYLSSPTPGVAVVASHTPSAGVTAPAAAAAPAATKALPKAQPKAAPPAPAKAAPTRSSPAPAAKASTARTPPLAVKKKPAPAVKKKARPAVTKKRRSRRTPAGIDDILSVGSRSRTRTRSQPARRSSPPPSSADDILSTGSRSRRSSRKPPRSSDADNILAAGSRRRSRASAKPKKSNLPAGLSRSQIQQTMRLALGAIASCYDKYGQEGIIKVRVKVPGSGRPEASVLGHFSGTGTAFCALKAVNKLRFPKFSGASITFTYPFKLK